MTVERPPYFVYVRNWRGEYVPQRWSEVPYIPVTKVNQNRSEIWPDAYTLLKPEHRDLSLNELVALFPAPQPKEDA